MSRFINLGIISLLSFSSLAAAETASDITRRFDFVFEKKETSGQLVQFHPLEEYEIPYVCTFNISGKEDAPLKDVILEKLKLMKTIPASISEITLDLHGVVHPDRKGWSPLTSDQWNGFWDDLEQGGYTGSVDSLGSLSIALGSLSDYVIKVSY